MYKMINLKVRKGLIALLLGANILTLSKEVKAEELNNEIVVEEPKSLIYQEEVKVDENTFEKTDNYYLTHEEIFSDDSNVRYVLLGHLDLETYNEIIMNRLSSNYIDATNKSFISRDKIIESCFSIFHLKEYNDDVDMVVSEDGIILGYTPKLKILNYNK